MEHNTPGTLYQSHQVLSDHIVPERLHGLGFAYHAFAACMEVEYAYETESHSERASLHGQFVSIPLVVFLAFTNTHERLCCVNNSFGYYVQGGSCRFHLGADKRDYLDVHRSLLVHSQETIF